MKKKALSLALGLVVVAATTALASYVDEESLAEITAADKRQLQEIWDAMANGKTNEVILRDAILRLTSFCEFLGSIDGGNTLGANMTILHGMKEACQEARIPEEQVIKTLEKMVREKLSVTGKGEVNNEVWNLEALLPSFGAFPDYDALPIFNECLRSASEHARYSAASAYAHIKGADAIPLLRETIEKGRLSDKSRWWLYYHLDAMIREFKGREKNSDAEELNAFVVEMRQKEKPDGLSKRKQQRADWSIQIPLQNSIFGILVTGVVVAVIWKVSCAKQKKKRKGTTDVT